MAKNKVINTVLNLRDNMSGGLIQAAKNAKKSGAQIDDSMMSATRKVVKFKNDSLKALQSWSKKSVVAVGAAVSGLAAAFVALDGATEEYRVAQGKLNAGFQTARFSADVARKSYRNFYAILGDTDTATEASQLLANMVKSEQGVAKWARIAAGVHGTFGDSLPIEGLVESSNETARTGQITGVFADAINWATAENEHFGVALKANTAANEEWNKAVEALVVAGILLYKNWDTVKAKAGELWTKAKTVFGGVRDTITGAFDAAKKKVRGFFSWLDDKVSSIPLLGGIYSGGKSALSWIGGKISGHAMGTPYFSGGLTRVNERGGEVMRLPSGTQIIPHDVSVKAVGGRGVTVNVTIQGNVIGNREYAEEMGDYVARRVLAACGNA